MSGGHCPCWVTVSLHEGHCCFRDHYDDKRNVVTCGHDDAGMAAANWVTWR